MALSATVAASASSSREPPGALTEKRTALRQRARDFTPQKVLGKTGEPLARILPDGYTVMRLDARGERVLAVTTLVCGPGAFAVPRGPPGRAAADPGVLSRRPR